MRVNIGELLADRGAVRTLAYSEPCEPPAEDAVPLRPLEGALVLASTGRTVCLSGRMRTALSLVCGACLVRFEHALEFSIAEEFGRAATSAAAAGEAELGPDDFVTPVGPDDTLDVTEVVRQHLILALPLAPRCREGCRGLCPACGADLNAGPCGCAEDRVDPRLRVLRRWATAHQGGSTTEKE
ncbi:MAG TPA: DUF177 domain-containing protein [bacterium]|nr:DUF177 domain-containing protein [bacterium]